MKVEYTSHNLLNQFRISQEKNYHCIYFLNKKIFHWTKILHSEAMIVKKTKERNERKTHTRLPESVVRMGRLQRAESSGSQPCPALAGGLRSEPWKSVASCHACFYEFAPSI